MLLSIQLRYPTPLLHVRQRRALAHGVLCRSWNKSLVIAWRTRHQISSYHQSHTLGQRCLGAANGGKKPSTQRLGEAELAVQLPAWRRLAHLLVHASLLDADGAPATELCGFTGTPSTQDDEETAMHHLRRASPLYCLWRQLYHPLFDTAVRSPSHRDTLEAAVDTHDKTPSLMQDTGDVSVAAAARHAEGTGGKTWKGHCLLPEEAEELPLFVQALGQLGTALQSRIHGSTSDPRRAFLTTEELYTWLAEVQALLLYVGQHQLCFLIPSLFHNSIGTPAVLPSTQNGAHTRHAPGRLMVTAAGASDGAETSARESTTRGDRQPRSDVQLHASDVPLLRPLAQREEERLCHFAPSLSQDQLLRTIVLVEAARTILDVAQPPPSASGVRAALYATLLSVLGACEQLPSSTLASLATCMARCLDSYVTRQHLRVLRKTGAEAFPCEKGDATVGEESGADAALDGNDLSRVDATRRSLTREVEGTDADVRRYLRSVATDALNATLRLCAAPVEATEAAELAQHRGGLQSMVRPTEVLQQLSVLAHVARQRAARTLRDGHCSENVKSTAPSLTEEPSAVTALATEKTMEDGLLGLLSLEERKVREGARTTASRSGPRPRRTIAQIQAATQRAAKEAASGPASAPIHDGRPPWKASNATIASHAENTYREPASPLLHERHLTLTDAAELCTALAAMGYRGSGGPKSPAHAASSLDPFWGLVANFVCAEANVVGEMLRCGGSRESLQRTSDAEDAPSTVNDSPSRVRSGGDGEAEAQTVRQLLRDVRDVTFALDRVGFLPGYDQVMQTLVQQKLLPEPIPAPSAGVRAMKDVPP